MQKFIPAELRSIILRLPSIPYLEAIVLLHRSPSQVWRSETLATRLYVTKRTALHIMTYLCSSGICLHNDGRKDEVIYQPEPESLKNLISNLVDYYAKNLIEVTNLIHANNQSQEKAQEFANAFIWRNDK